MYNWNESNVFCILSFTAVCIYKGKQYAEGQRWQDGCNYNCVCKDGMTGVYDCTEMWVKQDFLTVYI